MKKMIVFLFAAMALSTSSFAQDTTKHATTGMHKQMKDCVKMKDGKMMVYKDGKWSDMTKDMTLKNGTTVMKDGTVKKKDGTTMQLKDGEGMDMNGNMMSQKKGMMKKPS